MRAGRRRPTSPPTPPGPSAGRRRSPPPHGVGAQQQRAGDVPEDITQDALLRLYRAARDLHDELALDAWMYRIARTAIIDHHRRAAVRPQPAEIEPAAELPADEPDEPHAEESLAACVPVLLNRVPEHYRRALELTDLGGLTQQRAAAELGLSTSGMKSRVQRGRRLLREQVIHCCRVALDTHGALADIEPRRRDGRC